MDADLKYMIYYYLPMVSIKIFILSVQYAELEIKRRMLSL